jgi:ubiquinone/menaquinone biosynthesis C-methylase UbiE
MISRDLLIKELEILNRRNDEKLLFSLEERKLKELDFHDRDRDKEVTRNLTEEDYKKLHGNKKFYGTVQLSAEYAENWIRENSSGKIFLDYACGNGINAERAARAGAELAVGIDISNVSVKNARAMARENGVSENTFFLQADCENTGFPDNCIDLAICSGVLHHLDLSYAFYELRRILKPGGKILAVEALNYNPVIKLYRNMTPQMRTEWEKANILSYKDLRFASRFFEIKEVRHWHLFSIAGAFIPSALPVLNGIDRVIINLPVIRLMSWMFTFEMHKPLKK